MSEYYQQLAQTLNERFDSQITSVVCDLGEVTMVVPQENLLEVCRTLRDEAAFAFEEAIDVCGVDYSEYPDMSGERYAVVYHLLSVANNHRLRLRTFAQNDEMPVIPSVVEIWNGVNWFEREAFDLFGIIFEGHPDMRRILTDYGFIGHPFRKDFPISGNVEMRYDEDKKRVIYEPVTIEPRDQIPKVTRDDHRYISQIKNEAHNDA
jgi:NADH-quinone oxidoreductase subunit C